MQPSSSHSPTHRADGIPLCNLIGWWPTQASDVIGWRPVRQVMTEVGMFQVLSPGWRGSNAPRRACTSQPGRGGPLKPASECESLHWKHSSSFSVKQLRHNKWYLFQLVMWPSGNLTRTKKINHAFLVQEPWLYGGGDADRKASVGWVRGHGGHIQDRHPAHQPTAALAHLWPGTGLHELHFCGGQTQAECWGAAKTSLLPDSVLKPAGFLNCKHRASAVSVAEGQRWTHWASASVQTLQEDLASTPTNPNNSSTTAADNTLKTNASTCWYNCHHQGEPNHIFWWVANLSQMRILSHSKKSASCKSYTSCVFLSCVYIHSLGSDEKCQEAFDI